MTKFVHISDLHFGDADTLRLQAAANAINSIEPDCVIMTGDLTQSGRRAEFAAAKAWLAQITAPIVGCPGNHDAPVFNVMARIADPFGRFKALGLQQCWLSRDGSIAIEAANSARGLQSRLDWSQGDYGQPNVLDALDRLTRSKAGLRLLALHHPPETPKGARVKSQPLGVAIFKARAQKAMPSMILCGHVHDTFYFQADAVGGLMVATAPSLASHRGRGFGSGFVVMEIEQNNSAMRRTLWRFESNAFVDVALLN